MKKLTILLLLAIVLGLTANAQKVISGKSQNTLLKITSEYKRGLPPIIYADMNFEDDNNDSILDANEDARLHLKLINKGKGAAQGLKVSINDNVTDPEFIIDDGQEIPFIYPDNSVEVTIPMHAGFNIKSAKHKLEINVREYFGYDMDPVCLILSTRQFQDPKLEFAGLQIIDIGEGTVAIVQDGQLQAGEQVKAKIVVQNTGQNISKNTKYSVTTLDENIYISEGQGVLGDISPGEIKEFWIAISPNKRITSKEQLPVFLSTTNEVSKGNIYKEQLPITLDQKPPEIITFEVKADIDKFNHQSAHFKTNSNRITANVGKVIDIKQILPSHIKRSDAIAVLIGLENYDYFAPAPFAENDAAIMSEYFKNVLGIDVYHIYLYKSMDVRGFFFHNIFDPLIGDLQRAVNKGETDVFIYYSGHGIPNKDGSKVYLLPKDGKAEDIERQGYDLNMLFQNLQALEAKSITIFIDACFSGISRTSENVEPQNLLAMKGALIKPEINEIWQTNPNFTIFMSSDYNQTSLGFDATQTGLFTYYLCAGLQGKADANGDKTITTGELQDYVTEQVTETSTKIRGLQVPQFHGNRNVVLTEY